MEYVIGLVVGVFILSIGLNILLINWLDNTRKELEYTQEFLHFSKKENSELKRQVYDEGEDPDDHYKEIENMEKEFMEDKN